ncbi:MAG: hypothetical protein PHV55_05330 [Candidatus Omnitrophica bacterium]|nr:hypothetical protein [Candidatus Omnitrophota bacterium]
MSYKLLIKNWHAKAAEEDYFSKFVFEYLSFIAHLKTQLYTSDLKDRQAMQKLKQDENIRSRYLLKIQSLRSLKQDWEHIKRELDRTRLGNASNDLNNVEEIEWWNCSREHLNQMTQIERDKLKGVIYSLDDWENMVEFWHSIRNNFFHGAKNPENPRDQFAVKYGYRTLRELMEILLND